MNLVHFEHFPNATMISVEAMSTSSFVECLRSVGGISVLLPLFTQMNQNVLHFFESTRPSVYGALLGFILGLARSSAEIRMQLMQVNGFLVLGYLLEQANTVVLTEGIVDAVVVTARFLQRESAAGSEVCLSLLRSLFEHVAFNFRIWMNAAAKLQIAYWGRVAAELGRNPLARSLTGVRRILKALQEFYSSPMNLSRFRSASVMSAQHLSRSPSIGASERAGVDPDQLPSIRLAILSVLKAFICADGGITLVEFEEFLHFIAEASEIGNQQIDFLHLFLQLVTEQTERCMAMLEALDGIGVLLSQLRSSNEDICVHALRIIGVALQHATPALRQNIVRRYELSSTVALHLTRHWKYLPLKLYHTLFDLLTHSVAQLTGPAPRPHVTLKQPELLAVFFDFFGVGADISSEELQSTFALPDRSEEDNFAVVDQFLDDLLCLLREPENITALDKYCSSWQRGLLLLLLRAMIGRDVQPATWTQPRWSQQAQMILFIFRILLLHAIKGRRDGWRVWQDLGAVIGDVFTRPDMTQREVVFGLTTHRFFIPGAGEVLRLCIREVFTSLAADMAVAPAVPRTDEPAIVANMRAQPHALVNILSVLHLCIDQLITMAAGPALLADILADLKQFAEQQGFPAARTPVPSSQSVSDLMPDAEPRAEHAVNDATPTGNVAPNELSAVPALHSTSPAPQASSVAPDINMDDPTAQLAERNRRFPTLGKSFDDLALMLDELVLSNNFDLRETELRLKLLPGTLVRQCARFLVVKVQVQQEQGRPHVLHSRDAARIRACFRRIDAGPKVAASLFSAVAMMLAQGFIVRFPAGPDDAVPSDVVAVLVPFIEVLRGLVKLPGSEAVLAKLFCDRDNRPLLLSQPQWVQDTIPPFAAAMNFVSRDWLFALSTTGAKCVAELME